MSESIAYMDKYYYRMPNELKWLSFKPNIVIPEFRDTVHIVGKGPSLDSITAKQLNDGCPIICINESVHQIVALGTLNPVYTVQQDSALMLRCSNPGSHLFANVYCCQYLGDKALYYRPEDYGLTGSSLSVVLAMALVARGGGKHVKLWAFDGAKTGTVLGYAASVHSDPRKGGSPARFSGHKPIIEREAEARELGHEFM
jgi:hypothetical protein